ncbi:hypothetical protein CAEBREN_28892 [Caenorhabditis brenneri]|uniref:Uncharacterized protein n=1 Tax=Caenorhabditis brenneri TaxID=135651 RepID=G0PHU7_CAEBE|nr:hypothetical protein CAEBREN_28892 [Caenorhabditis brenneri]
MMLPNSCNLPVRRREEKGKRKEGKSQGRRGATTATKSRAMPAVVAIPSKTPSPASTPLPPPVMVPPVATVPLPLANVLKDPTAMSPNLMAREGKQIRRKIKDKVEKDPPKTTIRKKKNSATQSISIEAKTSSENDGCIGSKNGKKKSMTNAGRKQSSLENKSDGSKESTDNDEKTPQRPNKEIIKSFFQMMSQRAKKRSDDARLETMPESSQINVSARALRKKIKKQPKTDQQDTNFFKPNGDPVWITPERAEKDCPRDEDGVIIKNPELVAALAEDGFDLEDEKDWYALIDSYMGGSLESGPQLSDDYEFDVYGTIESMEANNKVFNKMTVTFNTVKNLYEGSEIAMKRFIASKSNDGDEPRPNRTVEEPAPQKTAASTEQFQLKTCVVTNVSFDKKRLLSVKYDRHHPRASIQKFRKKLNNTCSMEQTTQNESKEKC